MLLEYAFPVWGGIPTYLEEEIERVQERSVRILSLERNSLEPLSLRRKDTTLKELERIQEDPINPCNRFLSTTTHSDHYYLRKTRKKMPT